MYTIGSLLLLTAVSATVSGSFEDRVKMDWKTIEGKLREITIARDYDSGHGEIYGVSSNGQIWTCRLPCDGVKNKWVLIPGRGAHIAANEQEVWKTNPDFSIDRCQKPCSGNWVRQPGQLRTISLGPDVLWGVNHVDDMWRTPIRRGAGPAWQLMNNGNKFIWVSVGIDSDVWAILKSGEVVRFNPINNSWTKIPGKGKRITVGQRYLYLVDENDQLMRCERPCKDGKWLPVENGNVRAVAAEWSRPRKLYALKPDNTIVRGKSPKNCPKCCNHKSAALAQQSRFMSMMSSPYYRYWMPWQSYLSSSFTNQTTAVNQNQVNPYVWNNYWSNWQQPQSWNYDQGQRLLWSAPVGNNMPQQQLAQLPAQWPWWNNWNWQQ